MSAIPFQSTGPRDPRPARLRRSYLAVPGSSPKMMRKAAEVGADAIFLDLEDAVAPDEKARARESVLEALATHDYGDALLAVRVNDVASPWCHEDIVALVRGGHQRLHALMIPKVTDAGQLWFVEHLLNQVEGGLAVNPPDSVGTGGRLGVEVMLESGAGSVNLTDICRVTDRTETLLFGPGDYARDMGVAQPVLGMVEPSYPGHQWHYVMAQIVNHARALAADAVDGPYADLSDAEGFRASCARARLLGFDGKMCIHPSQVALANAEFTPSAEQVEHATELLAAYAQAREEGKGATSLHGAMIDDASRRMAEKVLARAEASGQAIPWRAPPR